jgi:hypothetical protein
MFRGPALELYRAASAGLRDPRPALWMFGLRSRSEHRAARAVPLDLLIEGTPR